MSSKELRESEAKSFVTALESIDDENQLTSSQQILVDKKKFMTSLYVVRFAVFAASVNNTVESPNYPIMVLPGAHPDSFTDTGGFGFSAATYFMPMTAKLGVAATAIIIGSVSDRIGRKPCNLFCLYGGVIASIAKYTFRKSFWLYNLANFVNGLLNGTLPIAMAYVGDIYSDRKQIGAEIGLMVGIAMLGISGGGIIAILMESSGLFTPLLLAAGFMFVAAVLATKFMVESNNLSRFNKSNREEEKIKEEESEEDASKSLDIKTLVIIVIGALLDNIGSSGLMPLCLSPLAFNAYYTDFVDQGSQPLMSQVAYKWIAVFVALMVIPGTMLTPPVFNRIGPAGGCILGNIITGVVTICLLYIGLAPATKTLFILFVILLYLCFPFTVISQLSTGPMLDAIAPPDKKGCIQGLNTTVMNIGSAVSPMILGAVADAAGTPVAIWICIGISFFAGVANSPLMFVKGLGIPPKKIPADKRPLIFEDEDVVKQILNGEWVSPDILRKLNDERMKKGEPYLVIHPGKYEDDKQHLENLKVQAIKDYQYYKHTLVKNLKELREVDNLSDICNKVNVSMSLADKKEVEISRKEMGEWFADYLIDSGYQPHTAAQIIKQMIMSAFPVVNKGNQALSPENLEPILLNYINAYGNYITIEDGDHPHTALNVLAAGRSNIGLRESFLQLSTN